MVEPLEAESPRRFPLWARVLAGVAIGIALGAAFGSEPWLLGLSNEDLGPLGMLVIRMLKTLATPLICVAILDSFLKSEISGRSGARLLATCGVNVTAAMVLGLVLLNVFEPGRAWTGHLSELAADLGEAARSPGAAPAGASLSPLRNLAGFVPESVVEPFAKNLVISIVLLAVLAGAALRSVKRRAAGGLAEALRTTEHVIEVAFAVLTRMLLWVAELMPFAVLVIVAQVVGRSGLRVFEILWVFLAAMLAGLLLHCLVYHPVTAWLVGRKPPPLFFRKGADAIVTAISCNSSLATMPVTLRCLAAMGVRPAAARLSACVGTNFNNDGIMLYEAMATIFICQALGYELTLAQQVTICLASIMAGVGIAGIPEAGLIILPLVLATAGLPEAAIAAAIPLIVPVDWIIARVRSGVNVIADMTVACVLDRFEPRG